MRLDACCHQCKTNPLDVQFYKEFIRNIQTNDITVYNMRFTWSVVALKGVFLSDACVFEAGEQDFLMKQ